MTDRRGFLKNSGASIACGLTGSAIFASGNPNPIASYDARKTTISQSCLDKLVTFPPFDSLLVRVTGWKCLNKEVSSERWDLDCEIKFEDDQFPCFTLEDVRKLNEFLLVPKQKTVFVTFIFGRIDYENLMESDIEYGRAFGYLWDDIDISVFPQIEVMKTFDGKRVSEARVVLVDANRNRTTSDRKLGTIEVRPENFV